MQFFPAGPNVVPHVAFLHENHVREFELMFLIGVGARGDDAENVKGWFMALMTYIGSLCRNSDALRKIRVYGGDWHGDLRECVVQALDRYLEVEGRYIGGPFVWETEARRFDWKGPVFNFPFERPMHDSDVEEIEDDGMGHLAEI